jgi:hypothetical protein
MPADAVTFVNSIEEVSVVCGGILATKGRL